MLSDVAMSEEMVGGEKVVNTLVGIVRILCNGNLSAPNNSEQPAESLHAMGVRQTRKYIG